jgi:hypothetical protein
MAMNHIFAFLVLAVLPAIGIGQPLIVTPDREMNRSIAGRPLSEVPVLRTGETGGAMILDPVLPPDWTWLAGRGLQGKKGLIEFFFHNGILFTNSSEPTVISFRTRRYPDVFTDRMRANVFVIGFQKEDEGVVFAASETDTVASVVIDKSVFDRELSLTFALGAGEGRLIRILRRYPPYMP